MSSAEDLPVYLVGSSGRLPYQTICALELANTEIPRHLHRWNTLLSDLHIRTTGPLLYPRRLVKGGYGIHIRTATLKAAQALGRQRTGRLIEALAEFPTPLVAHMPKRHAKQAERDLLTWLCTRLAGRPSGLAVFHTSRGVKWYSLTADCPDFEPLPPGSPALETLSCHATKVEPLLTLAKLDARVIYLHKCYGGVSCRPTWLPQDLLFEYKDCSTEIYT
ncbi:hypothetical protein ACFU99_18255 [Streptomyces sp. NPDC057654]|uniref:hypothetical protein n=1 Tax=Streptomyces sp. NPDC057654 TaxID=3346196 RepID=UPI0036A9952C